ncbi:armadillo-like helical domain-containing protein 4 [Ctenodactylus gundi]
MSGSYALRVGLTFCSLLFLGFGTRCLAFPQRGKREIAHAHGAKGWPERISTGDLEHSSVTPEQTPQLVFSKDPVLVSAGPSAVPFSEAFSVNRESPPTGAGLMQPASPGLPTATKPAVPADEVFSSSQPEKVSLESSWSKAVLALPVTASASLSVDEEEPFSSTSILSPVVGTTEEATRAFLRFVGDQEGASLEHSPLYSLNTEDMLTTNPRTEKFEADTGQRTASFPGAESPADTEPGSLLSRGEKPVQMTADDTRAAATGHLLATSAVTLRAEPETEDLLGAPELTASVSAAALSTSALSDEWDDTKLESVSRVRTPELRDNLNVQVRMGLSHTALANHDVMEGDYPLMEETGVTPGLPEGETHVGTTLLLITSQEDERSPASIDQGSFTPSNLAGDVRVSAASLFQSTGAAMDSTKEDRAVSPETTVSASECESEVLGNAFKDMVTQEMTTATREPDPTLPMVTQEQISTPQIPRDSGGTEEFEETEGSPSPASVTPGVTHLFRSWEPLATTASTTWAPLSLEVTSAVEDPEDTVTGPDEEFTPVLGSPVTPRGIVVEVTSMSPAFPASEATSERRTIPPSSRSNTAASYSLGQLESEEGEEEDDEEDEEDEDEEEEDEEEDEEDRDTYTLDESFDSDTELPGFTVPGVTSQEPDLEQGNLDPLEGATYQVPDALEWEQQNQGLVRSWMEKLKDKAGYMSGMLVPVGVGIAGALFILGALYSIKVMNRRRRNGFKRHKRKQREFNSMQDRVMLLADSSEDEF